MNDAPPSPAPAALLALLLCGCGSAPRADSHLAGTTLTIADDRVRPAAEVDLQPGGVVLFRNDTAAPLSIAIDGNFSCTSHCDTSFGFTLGERGDVADAVAPGKVVAICFHNVGRFPYVAQSGDRQWRGSIRVGGGQ